VKKYIFVFSEKTKNKRKQIRERRGEAAIEFRSARIGRSLSVFFDAAYCFYFSRDDVGTVPLIFYHRCLFVFICFIP
jgi:hypothetical protein